MVRYGARMDTQRRPHTRDFSGYARERLGLAVTRAREAAGYPFRPSFAAEAHISVRSLVKLEQGDPVGARIYESAARVLPNWDEDTPLTVLRDGPIPPTVADEPPLRYPGDPTRQAIWDQFDGFNLDDADRAERVERIIRAAERRRRDEGGASATSP